LLRALLRFAKIDISSTSDQVKPAFEVDIDIVLLGAARPESSFWPSKAPFGPHLQKKARKFNVSGTSTSPTTLIYRLSWLRNGAPIRIRKARVTRELNRETLKTRRRGRILLRWRGAGMKRW
jgi:hypothetical protein